MAVSLAMRVPAPLKPIADQVIRSASSVPANLAEGHGRSGRDRLHHFRIAYASAKEVDVHLRILCLSHTTHRGKAMDTFTSLRRRPRDDLAAPPPEDLTENRRVGLNPT